MTTGLWMERRGHGRPVVLLHGLGDDHTLWRDIAGTLPRAETIAFDLPGHGRSGSIPPGASIDWMAGCVLAALAGARLEHVVIVGLSMGGGIAQRMVLDAPDRIDAVVLVSTSPVFPPATVERFLARARLAETEGMAAIVDATVPRWFTPAWMASHPAEVDRTRGTVLRTDPVQFARASRANAARDMLDDLPTINQPVVFVGGLGDPADARRAAVQYVSALTDVAVHLLPAVSHLIPVEAPHRLQPILAGFLAGLDRNVREGAP